MTYMLDRLVLVEWDDAYGPTYSWEDVNAVLKATPETILARTVGWVVHDNDDVLTMAQSQTNENEGHIVGLMTIPKVTIKRVFNLGFSGKATKI